MKFCPRCGAAIEDWEALCEDCWKQAFKPRRYIIEARNHSGSKKEGARILKEISRILLIKAEHVSDEVDKLLSRLLNLL